jgi:exodeoxyribonuclease VII small subunit
MAELNYESASKELEEILTQLRNDEVSIDQLAPKVERASKLIMFCKEKLHDTEKKVEDIIAKLGL